MIKRVHRFLRLSLLLAVCLSLCGCAAPRTGDALVLVNGVYSAADGAFYGDAASQIQFWTPSTSTWAAIVTPYDSEADVPPEDRWQKVTQEQIDVFGRRLRESGLVGGWRYHEVFGYGEFTRKPGLWWTATTREKVDPDVFGAFVTTNWPGLDRVYMEVWSAPETCAEK